MLFPSPLLTTIVQFPLLYSPDVYSIEGSKLTGITWDGKYIWAVDEGNKRIYKHNLFRMQIRNLFEKIIPW